MPKKPKPPQDCVMRCANCAHYEAKEYECRRYPPAALIAPEGVGSAFPPSDPEEWCGEFARKDN